MSRRVVRTPEGYLPVDDQVESSSFIQLVANATTAIVFVSPGGPFPVLLSTSIDTVNAIALDIEASLSFLAVGTSTGAVLQLAVDGVVRQGRSESAGAGYGSVALALQQPVTAGPHLVELRWATVGSGSIECFAATRGDREGASLLVNALT